jgi:pimeloyl-ACP methyl ester carboxylesterase
MRYLLSRIVAGVLLSLSNLPSAGAADLPAALVTEEFMVDAGEPGIQLYVRNKHPADMAQVAAGHVLLYVHGSTLPSESTFDLALDGLSWMDYIASHGWDVYLMDVRGYGRSTRAPAFAEAKVGQAPIVWTDMKVQDVGAVVEFIRKRRGVDAISLLGWSWGTVVTGAYAAGHGDHIGSLVLYAPVWCTGPCDFDPDLAKRLAAAHAANQDSAAAVVQTMGQARRRIQAGVPESQLDALMPPAWFAAWSEATLATDPVGAQQDPPVLRSPAGVSQDSGDYWDAGKSYYDPKAITAPALVVVGEWDALTPPSGARALHDALANSPGRRMVEIAEGTHAVMLETNRMALFREVQRFLDEAAAGR